MSTCTCKCQEPQGTTVLTYPPVLTCQPHTVLLQDGGLRAPPHRGAAGQLLTERAGSGDGAQNPRPHTQAPGAAHPEVQPCLWRSPRPGTPARSPPRGVSKQEQQAVWEPHAGRGKGRGGRTGVCPARGLQGCRSGPWPLPRKARMATGPPSALQSARLSSRCQDAGELGAARARVSGPHPLPGAGLAAAGPTSPPPLPRPPSLYWTTSASPQPGSFLQSSGESASSVKPTPVANPLPEVLQPHAATAHNSPVLPTRALHPHARQELPVKIKGGPPQPSRLG